MPTHKYSREISSAVESAGAKMVGAVTHRGKHCQVRIRYRGVEHQMVVPASPSDFRWIKNLRSFVRRWVESIRSEGP